MPFSPEVEDAINSAAARYGLDPNLLRTYARIESGGDPSAKTGSQLGLFQLSDDIFRAHGGGNILSPRDNANAAASFLKNQASEFSRKYGRQPTASDLYLRHQQGSAGAEAHMSNPEGTAWKNVRPYYTDSAARRKGFESGDDYAKAAIWGNVPKDQRAKFGSVDNVTSGQFMSMWGNKVGRLGGENIPATAPKKPDDFDTALDSFNKGFASMRRGIEEQQSGMTGSQQPVAADAQFSPQDPRLAALAYMASQRQPQTQVPTGGNVLSAIANPVQGANPLQGYMQMVSAGGGGDNALSTLARLFQNQNQRATL